MNNSAYENISLYFPQLSPIISALIKKKGNTIASPEGSKNNIVQ